MLDRNRFALEATYVNRAFQMAAELIVKNSVFGTVKYNSTVIYNWTKNKFVSLQMPDNIRSYTKNRMGYEVNIIYKSEEPYFCMKASHPDNEIPGRIWTIEAEIIVVNEKILFGVKVSYSTPKSSEADSVGFSIPKFVSNIIRRNGVKDVRILGKNVWDIKCEGDIEQLYDLIQNSNRRMPVVVITENNAYNGIGEQYIKGYLIDAEVLVRNVGSIAHIVRIPANIMDKWCDVTGKNWGVYGGAIRTYFPEADFTEDNYMHHPLSVVNRIMASIYTDESGNEYVAGEAFRHLLENNLKKYNTNVRLDWEELGHKFYFMANRELFKERENTLLDIEQLRKVYEMQIKELEEKISDIENESLTILMEMENKKKEIDEARDIIYRLNVRVDTLEQQLENSRGEKTDIPILNEYSKLQEWVETYFPGRICLHSRAIRTLKEAVYESPELVFKCIKLLGTTYYQMRMGLVTREEFNEQCQILGIEEEGAITDVAEGSLGDTYVVSYHGAKVKLDRHLRKGKTKDPRYCMRIYFFWCEEEAQVVIGSLPQHLTTSAT